MVDLLPSGEVVVVQVVVAVATAPTTTLMKVQSFSQTALLQQLSLDLWGLVVYVLRVCISIQARR